MGEEYIRKIMVLGSVPSLGPVILFDNIEDLFKWTKAGTGGDDVCEKSTTQAYNGSASLRIKTRTTGAAADDITQAYRYSYQRPGKRYQLETLFYITDRGNAKYTWFKVVTYDGTLRHFVTLGYAGPLGKWVYVNEADVVTDVPGGAQVLGNSSWHRFSVRYDAQTKKYGKFVCDGLELDLSAIGYFNEANTSAVRQEILFWVQAQAAVPPEAYFDDVLVMEI